MAEAPPKLTPEQLQSALDSLDGWSLRDEKLYRKFEFADFERAFAFMAGVALVAESAQHHPEWCNVYNRVECWLVTHDAAGITQKDVDLAGAMDALATA